jgi:hypothetical protein
MRSPSYRYLGLGELSPDGLLAMLGDHETLFVEHKGGVAEGEGYAISKAIASFANTLGGWVLVGVHNGEPTDGTQDGWEPPQGEEFVDQVRVRVERQIDPLPSFAADVRVIEGGDWDGRRVGVVRVYESADTPHIMRRGGNVFIREAAQDRRYRAEAIGSHHELVRLAERGAESRRIARDRLDEGRLPFTEDALGIRYTTAATEMRAFRTRYSDHSQIVLRLAPLTLLPRFEDWAMSEGALEACRAIVEALTDEQRTVQDPVPHPRGVAMTARDGDWRTLSARGGTSRRFRDRSRGCRRDDRRLDARSMARGQYWIHPAMRC